MFSVRQYQAARTAKEKERVRRRSTRSRRTKEPCAGIRMTQHQEGLWDTSLDVPIKNAAMEVLGVFHMDADVERTSWPC